MYLSLVFIPLISYCSLSLSGRFIGKSGAKSISVFLMAISVILSWFILYEVVLNQSPVMVTVGSWINIELLKVDWEFLFDQLSSVMLAVVFTVSFVVHLYSTEYMHEDPHIVRFLSYLSLFTFFMAILVTGSNLIQLFVGWEGVGLCSYLLIGFWSSRVQANKSAVKAMVVNRIGDLGLCLGIFLIFIMQGTVSLHALAGSVSGFVVDVGSWFGFEAHFITLVSFLFFIGAVGKSAQFGLHVWLPDAMEGPTPVSALIHAATMVTAGVFLILRCSFLFELSSTILLVLVFVGSLTALFAASVGLTQNDIKKVIAYSTCSQLGYMVFSAGLSNYAVSLFHLANHAFFKALLFLSAGSVIHAVSDEQDMRRFGGLLHLLPYSYIMVLVGSLALMGFPFLAGFYSKDLILESAYASYTASSHFAFWLGSVAALCTSFYSIRLIAMTFLGFTNLHRGVVSTIHEPGICMSLALFVLAIPSVLIGWLSKEIFVGVGTHGLGSTVFILPSYGDVLDVEFIPTFYKLLPLMFSCLGAFSSYCVYLLFKYSMSRIWQVSLARSIYAISSQKWFVDYVYNYYIVRTILTFAGSSTYALIDKGYLELFGPYGILVLVRRWSKKIGSAQTGYVHDAVFVMLASIVILLLSQFLFRSFFLLFMYIYIGYVVFIISWWLFCFILRNLRLLYTFLKTVF